MSEDILAAIAAYKRQEVVRRRAVTSPADLDGRIRAAGAPRGFRAALAKPQPRDELALIAEIKKASPSRGLIRADFEPAVIARAYEAGGATCLSVLTDEPSFQGADEHLVAARAASRLPCLRKEFLVDPWQVSESRALGADAILVILAMVDDSAASDLIAESRRLGMDALVETHDEAELDRAGVLGADLVGVNNRDLRSFATRLEITERLAEKAPINALLVTESGIATSADAARLARAGVRAMLVGESLMRQRDITAATRDLLARA